MQAHTPDESYQPDNRQLEDNYSFLEETVEAPQFSDRAAMLLQNISPESYQQLQQLLTGRAMREETLGYVLFFDKPMGWITVSATPSRYDTDAQSEDDLNGRALRRFQSAVSFNAELMQGIAAWNDTLPDDGKVFFKTTQRELFDPPGPAENGTRHVFAINVPATLEVLTQNRDIFEEALGVQGSPKAMLDAIRSCDSITEMFRHSEAAFGLLLGFGRTNALAYQRERNGLVQIGDYTYGYLAERSGVGQDDSSRSYFDRMLHAQTPHVLSAGFVSYESQDRKDLWDSVLARQRFSLGVIVEAPDMVHRSIRHALGHSQCSDKLRWPLFHD